MPDDKFRHFLVVRGDICLMGNVPSTIISCLGGINQIYNESIYEFDRKIDIHVPGPGVSLWSEIRGLMAVVPSSH